MTWRVRGCTARWLVVDLSGTAAGCTSLNGDSTLPGCGPRPRLRWFARATATGWRLVAAGPASGCADVHDAEPGFPTALCTSLPALPQD